MASLETARDAGPQLTRPPRLMAWRLPSGLAWH